MYLVADEHDGDARAALYASYLVPECGDVLEGVSRGDGVDDEESLAVLYVEVAHRRELLGARRVKDLKHRRRVVHSAHTNTHTYC